MSAGGVFMSPENQQQDMELLRRCRKGEPEAKEELIRKYTPMVRYIAGNYYVRSLDLDDILQEGLIGLLGAIDEYNGVQHEVKFSSFAYLCIARKIFNLIRQSNNSKNRVLRRAVSLQAYTDGEHNRTFMDLVATDRLDPGRLVEERWAREIIAEVLRNHLSVLEYTVVAMILRGYSPSEIHEETGIDTKSVDNARTRVRFKLRRLLDRYGSLLAPDVPRQVRRREDLYMNIN